MIQAEITTEQYQELMKQFSELSKQINGRLQDPKTVFLDNADVLKLLKVSRRTLQTWRTEGLISFSQIQNKLYYSLHDINELMQKHYKKRFA